MDPRIIAALSSKEWEKAVKLWRIVREEDEEGCAKICTGERPTNTAKCSSCLEGRLLALSLGSYSTNTGANRYLIMARELKKRSQS